MSSRIVNNEGVGKLEMTLRNLSTTSGAFHAFDQADLDAGNHAAVLVAKNQVGLGTTAARLFGKVVAVGEDLDSKGMPLEVVVQVKGCMQLTANATTVPAFTHMLAVKNGRVKKYGTTAQPPATVFDRSARVLDVWDTTRIDVLL